MFTNPQQRTATTKILQSYLTFALFHLQNSQIVCVCVFFGPKTREDSHYPPHKPFHWEFSGRFLFGSNKNQKKHKHGRSLCQFGLLKS